MKETKNETKQNTNNFMALNIFIKYKKIEPNQKYNVIKDLLLSNNGKLKWKEGDEKGEEEREKIREGKEIRKRRIKKERKRMKGKGKERRG